MIRNFADMTGKVQNAQYAQQGIEQLKDVGLKYKIYGGVGPFVTNLLNNIKEERSKMKDDASAKAAEDAAKAIIDAK
jgi:aminopeptidase N